MSLLDLKIAFTRFLTASLLIAYLPVQNKTNNKHTNMRCNSKEVTILLVTARLNRRINFVITEVKMTSCWEKLNQEIKRKPKSKTRDLFVQN